MDVTIIFDFDGVIADSTELFVDVFHKIAEDQKTGLSREQVKNLLQNKTTTELIESFKLNIFQKTLLLNKVRKLIEEQTENFRIVSNMKDVLAKLSKKGINLVLVTSNTESVVNRVFEKYFITYFDEKYFKSGLTDKDKVLSKLAEKYSGTKIFYIGDEVRDVEASKTAGVKSVAVTWGFNSKELLEKSEPDFLFTHPREILKIGGIFEYKEENRGHRRRPQRNRRSRRDDRRPRNTYKRPQDATPKSIPEKEVKLFEENKKKPVRPEPKIEIEKVDDILFPSGEGYGE